MVTVSCRLQTNIYIKNLNFKNTKQQKKKATAEIRGRPSFLLLFFFYFLIFNIYKCV